MKKVLWVVLAALLLVSCGRPVTSEPEKPLELTAKNIEGKWVLEGGTEWFEFFTTGKYNSNKENQKDFSLDTANNKITLHYTSSFGEDTTIERDIVVYKSYFIYTSKKYIKKQ